MVEDSARCGGRFACGLWYGRRVKHAKERENMNLALWNRNPMLDEFSRTRDELDRAMLRFFGTQNHPLTGFGTTLPFARIEGFAPLVDVGETDDEVTIRAEVPGVSSRDLDVTIEGNTLNISGKKEEKEEFEGENSYRCERRFGAFRRSIELPESVDPDRVNADFVDGVVTIRVAKKPGQRARRVEVKPVSRRVTVPG
jgi:HSP20 family protein